MLSGEITCTAVYRESSIRGRSALPQHEYNMLQAKLIETDDGDEICVMEEIGTTERD